MAEPAGEKLPALHGWHVVTPSPAKPASHRQVALPAGELEFGKGQGLHEEDPLLGEKAPGKQDTHDPDPAAENVPAAQAEH